MTFALAFLISLVLVVAFWARIERSLSGHLSLGPITVYGANAMHWAVDVRTPLGHVRFRLPLPCFGRWWPLYFYLSPNGAPWAATFMLGGDRSDRIRAPLRRRSLGLKPDLDFDAVYNALRWINDLSDAKVREELRSPRSETPAERDAREAKAQEEQTESFLRALAVGHPAAIAMLRDFNVAGYVCEEAKRGNPLALKALEHRAVSRSIRSRPKLAAILRGRR